ncbi:MAG TPA: NeuD/PglB/VioB family sugar acetyltransferase [Acidimicrobiia bacterium]
MTGLLVVGGGDQGRQVISTVEAAGRDRVVGVLDRVIPTGTTVAGHRVLGRDDELGTVAREHGAGGFVVAVGDNARRAALTERLVADHADLAPCTVVHPTASIAVDAAVGEGSIVLAGAVVGNGATVGRGALLCIRSSVDHDCTLGDYVSLAPGVTIAGSVRVGAMTALGVGASVVHGRTIGEHSVIGAGAVVLRDIPERVVAYGVPAGVIRPREPGEPYL